jgi:hypothetical protein
MVLPYLEIKIVDPEGKAVPRGETGEFCTRGYSVMKGYWNDAEKTRDFVAYGFVARTAFLRGHAPFMWRRLSRPCLIHVKASCARSVPLSCSYGACRAGLTDGLCHGSDEQSVHKARGIRHRYRHNDKRAHRRDHPRRPGPGSGRRLEISGLY